MLAILGTSDADPANDENIPYPHTGHHKEEEDPVYEIRESTVTSRGKDAAYPCT
jgi:hypothetical protein